MEISRPRALAQLGTLLSEFPVVALLGPRQVGKSTLARAYGRRWRGRVHVFDLEDPKQLARLDEPTLALERLRGLVVLDEVQRRPELFPVLRVLADRPSTPARFLVLGSASPELLRQASESLAGRIAFLELGGLELGDVGAARISDLWLRGGFPRSLLAGTDAASVRWRRAFVATFLERDLPQLGITIPAPTLRRFWSMLAHRHAQVMNLSELGRSMGVADTTVRRYLDVLEATYVVRQLPPWSENLGKRQVRTPKLYLSDSGLLHVLLGLATWEDLDGHPALGASWEGFLMKAVLDHLGADREEAHFWGTSTGAELDLLVVRGRKRRGFEFKRTAAPAMTKSMHIALADLGLDKLEIVHGGDESFQVAPKVWAVAASRLTSDIEPL